jgi:hypothetical protein
MKIVIDQELFIGVLYLQLQYILCVVVEIINFNFMLALVVVLIALHLVIKTNAMLTGVLLVV